MSHRPGDWDCIKCSKLNFASRQKCMNCDLIKPRAGDWYCVNCKQVIFASKDECGVCKRGRPINEKAYSQKPGDWKCPCGISNFSSRVACFGCQQPKVGSSSSVPPPVVPAPAAVSQKPGDWKCPCGTSNFASRVACFGCKQPKLGASGSSSSIRPVVPAPAAVSQKPGDWKCPCGTSNFASRVACFGCKQPKLGASSSSIPQPVVPAPAAVSSGECVVCLENKAEWIVTTCGHLGLCGDCGHNLAACPICRAEYQPSQLIKVFVV